MGIGLVGVVLVAALVLVLVVFWARTRRFAEAGSPTLRINLAEGFPMIRRNGYDCADVDTLLARVYDLVVSAAGRAEALEVLHVAQLDPAEGSGYDPTVVDLHLDAMIVALQTGRELPPRPGYR